MISTELIWFICGLVLILAEFAVPGVILVFFGIGAWIVALALFVGIVESPGAQLLLFAAASVALLVVLRKWIRQRFSGFVSNSQSPEKNLDEFEGRRVVVIEDIAPGKPGKVEFKGAPWSARSEDILKKGESGTIKQLDGLTLIVEK